HGTFPAPEPLLDDRPYLLPRQPAVADSDPRDGDALDPLAVGLLPHPPQGGLDGLVAGPCPPVSLLRAQVEDPGPAVGLPEPGIAKVEPAVLGLAAAAVLLVHRGVAVTEALGDAGTHRALAVAAVGQSLGLEAVGEQVARDEFDGHGAVSPAVSPGLADPPA